VEVAIVIYALASIALGGVLVASLDACTRAAASEIESTLVLVRGTVFTVCFSISWLVWTAPLLDMPDDRARALAQAEAYLGYDDVGWLMLGAGGVAAALAIVAASTAARRAGLSAGSHGSAWSPASSRSSRSCSWECWPGWPGSRPRRS
jgi:hypothetical protein